MGTNTRKLAREPEPTLAIGPLNWDFDMERVTRIKLALSAWESVPPGLLGGLTCEAGCPRVTVRDRSSPGLMARQWPGDPGRASSWP
jgi:hypothetical protein